MLQNQSHHKSAGFPEETILTVNGQYGGYRLCFYSLLFSVVQGISTGKFHAAVMTNSEQWEVACVRAGRSSGDLTHPLVYCPELHFSEFNSSIADMKNSVAVSDKPLIIQKWTQANDKSLNP